MFLYVEKWTLKSEKSREKKVKKAFEQWIKKNWCEALLSTKAGKREKKIIISPHSAPYSNTSLHFTEKEFFFLLLLFAWRCEIIVEKSKYEKTRWKIQFKPILVF